MYTVAKLEVSESKLNFYCLVGKRKGFAFFFRTKRGLIVISLTFVCGFIIQNRCHGFCAKSCSVVMICSMLIEQWSSG